MFQCKREKEIGPTRVASIIAENVNAAAPPYGYVLAAPANFSKASFDAFREALRQRGVMEFHLWGRAALEDMLHQPKNDHILFTFFGISLVSRRRSRATEIRAGVTAKNKVKKLFGEHPHGQPLLLRDTKDSDYPFKQAYPDFDKFPRWKEYPVVESHPLGIIVAIHKYFAFVGRDKKTWDFTNAVDLIGRQADREDQESQHAREKAEDYWQYLESSTQAKFIVRGLVRFDSMVVIDAEGDVKHGFPHIYVDFQGKEGPFRGWSEYLERNGHEHLELDELERIELFPKTLPEQRLGTRRVDRSIILTPRGRSMAENMRDQVHRLYDCDKRYADLNIGDVVRIDGTKDYEKKELLAKITYRSIADAKEYLDADGSSSQDRATIEEEIGRQLGPADKIEICEFRIVYEWQVKNFPAA